MREILRVTLLAGIPLVAWIGCTPPLILPPELHFVGHVMLADGVGVPSVVVLSHRYRGCQTEAAYEVQVDSDSSGGFSLVYPATPGLTGCFVLKAFPNDPEEASPDSVVLVRDDLEELGDPLGTGLVEVDIILEAQ